MQSNVLRQVLPFISKPTNRNRLLIIFKLLITAALLWYFKDKFSTVDFWKILLNADPRFLLAGFSISFINFAFQIEKWRSLSKACFGKDKYSDALISFFQGMTLGIISPMRAGEIVGRKLYHQDVPLVSITLTTFADKLQNYALNLLFGSLAGLLYIFIVFSVPMGIAAGLTLLVIVAYSLFALLLFKPKLLKSTARFAFGRFQFFEWLREKIQPLLAIDRNVLRRTFLFSGLSYMVLMMQYSFLFTAYEPHIHFFTGVQLGSLTIFTKSVIPAVTFIDFGVRELSSMYFSKHLGFSETAGFNAAFMLFLLNLVVPSLIGLLFITLRKAGIRAKK